MQRSCCNSLIAAQKVSKKGHEKKILKGFYPGIIKIIDHIQSFIDSSMDK